MLWYVLNNGTVSWPHRHSTLLQKCALAVPTGLASMLILFTCLPFYCFYHINVLVSIAEQVLYSTYAMQWSMDIVSVFCSDAALCIAEGFSNNYPSAVSAIGMCYHLRKHSHASLSVSLYHSLMWKYQVVSESTPWLVKVDFWMYHLMYGVACVQDILMYNRLSFSLSLQ